MKLLNKGEYTGEIVSKMMVDDSIITTTHYSSQKNNPDWHNHENLHICFVFEGGKAETKKETSYTQKGGSIFFYHAEETHRWISPNPVSKSANIEIGQAFLDKYVLKESDIKKAILPHKLIRIDHASESAIYLTNGNLDTCKNKIFSVDTTPDVCVFKACSASMALPILFKPVKIDDDYYYDGGFTNNFPIKIFENVPMDNILGMILYKAFYETEIPDEEIVRPKISFMFLLRQFIQLYERIRTRAVLGELIDNNKIDYYYIITHS